MKKYEHKFTYYFYLMKNKKTGELRISSFHNIYGVCNPKSKLWTQASNLLLEKTVSNRTEYLKCKSELENKYIHRD